ncbi:MAG: 2-phosphosulfolactate phosphatase [Sciscionella sp.]
MAHRAQLDSTHPWSLSAAGLRSAPRTQRLVLPSPNGSTIAAGAAAPVVIAACLRNAGAVGAALRAAGYGGPGHSVAVIAAGERWPDHSLRPALEDLLGAGAVLAALGAGMSFSAEATAARATYRSAPHPLELLRSCSSARELRESGFGADVDVAADLDACAVVPAVDATSGGAFVDRAAGLGG